MMAADAGTSRTVNPLALRDAMARWASGVAVVTSLAEDGPAGLTINSFASVSWHPATVQICLNTSTRGYHAVRWSGRYALNILSASQAWLAELFAKPGLSQAERFKKIRTTKAETGSPVIPATCGWFDCRVVDVHHFGTHGMFIAEVVAAGADMWEEAPLIYHNRRMAGLLTAQERPAGLRPRARGVRHG